MERLNAIAAIADQKARTESYLEALEALLAAADVEQLKQFIDHGVSLTAAAAAPRLAPPAPQLSPPPECAAAASRARAPVAPLRPPLPPRRLRQ